MKEEFKKYLAMILAVFCTAALSILLFGFVGMIIGVPVFAVIYDILRKMIIKGLQLRKKEGMFREYEAEYPRK